MPAGVGDHHLNRRQWFGGHRDGREEGLHRPGHPARAAQTRKRAAFGHKSPLTGPARVHFDRRSHIRAAVPPDEARAFQFREDSGRKGPLSPVPGGHAFKTRAARLQPDQTARPSIEKHDIAIEPRAEEKERRHGRRPRASRNP